MKETILTKEEKKEVMKRMRSEPKTDFVDLIIEMKKNDLGREKFIEKVWEWKKESGGKIWNNG